MSDGLARVPALTAALGGFSSSAVALVAAALALAAAMQATGLHRRLALHVLRVAGEKTSHLVAGAIAISVVLAFFVPSATARAGAVVPILLGMVAAFGLPKDSKLAALLVITATQAVSIWNVGIKTAAAQNLVAVGFIEDQLGQTVSWGQWFLWAAPWSVLMSIALFFIMRWAIKPEAEAIEGGRELVEKQLAEMGPMTGAEKRLTAGEDYKTVLGELRAKARAAAAAFPSSALGFCYGVGLNMLYGVAHGAEWPSASELGPPLVLNVVPGASDAGRHAPRGDRKTFD